jgi:hypothetical protein
MMAISAKIGNVRQRCIDITSTAKSCEKHEKDHKISPNINSRKARDALNQIKAKQ